jgi:hypothetical protein
VSDPLPTTAAEGFWSGLLLAAGAGLFKLAEKILNARRTRALASGNASAGKRFEDRVDEVGRALDVQRGRVDTLVLWKEEHTQETRPLIDYVKLMRAEFPRIRRDVDQLLTQREIDKAEILAAVGHSTERVLAQFDEARRELKRDMTDRIALAEVRIHTLERSHIVGGKGNE